MKVLVLCSDRAEGALFTEEEFILRVTGVGKENALLNTVLAIKECDPDLIINVGTCGAKMGEASIGDICTVKRVINRDADLTMYRLPKYTTLSADRSTEGPLDIAEEGFVLASSDTLAVTAIEEAGLYDMEAFGIAKASKALGKPLVIIKGVSDIVGEHVALKDYRKVLKKLASDLHEEALRLCRERREFVSL